jgi:hypothetical protein
MLTRTLCRIALAVVAIWTSIAMAAAASPYGSTTAEAAAEQLLNFAEAAPQFRQYFPSHQPTNTFQRYRFRFYPETGIYLGVAINVVAGDGLVEGGVYFLRGQSGGSPVYAGLITAFITPSAANTETSYANAKNHGLSRIQFPPSISRPVAWGAADFFHTGSLDIFTAKLNYNLSMSYATVTSDPGYMSDLQFWRQLGDGTSSLIATYKGCVHPRKAVVADFNLDGWPDVFVACHGYDAIVAGRFPGEKNKLLLSDGSGGFTVRDVGDAGFYHGASAADVDGDGYPDIVVANISNPGGKQIHFLMNQRDGTFRLDNTRVPQMTGPFFSVELLDVDGDGLPDLIVGGNETYPGAPATDTAILYGNFNGTFGATRTVVPPVFGRGVALDFTLVTNNGQKVLYVGRTAIGNDPAFPSYSTRTLQAFNLATGASVVVLDEKAAWIRWWVATTRNGQNGVAPYDLADPDFFFSP